MKKLSLFTLFFLFSLQFFSCNCNNLESEEYIGYSNYKLVTHNNESVNFPADYSGKLLFLSFIFTNCPDICPLTTHNIFLIQQRIKEENIPDVHFLVISFDPDRDKPEILKKYSEVRGYNLQNWDFLTGEKKTIDSIMKDFNVVAISGDTSFTPSGLPVYFFTHTDRISLIDKKLNLRKNYKGSEIDIEEIISDLKNIGD